MPFIETQADISGHSAQIFYEDLGQGRPVVFIHGWPLSHEMWEYQVNAFTDAGFRCITYDRRGFGRSSRPVSGYDYDILAADLKSLLDTLDLQDVVLIGFSMGGGEVVRYCSRYDCARVSRVVLLGSVTPYMYKIPDNPDGVEPEVFAKMTEQIKEDRMGFLENFGKQFYGVSMISHPVSTAHLENDRRLAAVASPLATLACAHSFSTTDFRKDMALVHVPTLIIHGDADKTVPIESSGQRSAAMIPNNEFIVYQGAPHGFYFTEKQKLNEDLLRFCSK
jgi:pimeloyl-ACP methyl ester carboxylesterase